MEVKCIGFWDKRNADVSLHDCGINKIQYDEQFFRFCIPDGFYIIHEKNTPKSKFFIKAVRTGRKNKKNPSRKWLRDGLLYALKGWKPLEIKAFW